MGGLLLLLVSELGYHLCHRATLPILGDFMEAKRIIQRPLHHRSHGCRHHLHCLRPAQGYRDLLPDSTV
jgi:hypothetical protein